MNRALHVGVIAILSASGCSRCDRATSTPVHVVGRVLSDTATLAMLEDGTVVLDTGVLVHRIPDDGALELVGDRASYAAFMPAEDGTPVARLRARGFYGSKDAPMMLEGGDAYALTDRVWTRTKSRVGATLATPFRTRERRRDTSMAVPPSDVKAQSHVVRSSYRKYPDGTFVGLGRSYASTGGDAAPIGLVVRPGAREEALVPIPDATGIWRCEQAPSADGKPYVDCRGYDGPGEERRLYELDLHTWARVTIPSRDLDAPLAIAKDGSIWMGLSDPPRLAVRTRAGRIDGIPLPTRAPRDLARASYSVRSVGGVAIPRRHMVSDVGNVFDLAPLAGGSMIVLAREQGSDGALVVMRAGGTAIASPTVIGTELDQQVDIRNADPPKRWIGHCSAVFVHLPRTHDAGALELQPTMDGTWVSGRLHDKTLSGVVFADRNVFVQEVFEQAVSVYVEEHTTNPAAPPEVTCTLPVLDEVR